MSGPKPKPKSMSDRVMTGPIKAKPIPGLGISITSLTHAHTARLKVLTHNKRTSPRLKVLTHNKRTSPINKRTYVCVCMCMYVCMYVYVRMYVCMYVCLYGCMLCRSPINKRTSPINKRTSPINKRTSPINKRTSPTKNHRISPIGRRQSPSHRRTTHSGIQAHLLDWLTYSLTHLLTYLLTHLLKVIHPEVDDGEVQVVSKCTQHRSCVELKRNLHLQVLLSHFSLPLPARSRV